MLFLPDGLPMAPGKRKILVATQGMPCSNGRANEHMPNSFKLNLVHRPRRLRRTPGLRALVEDTVLRPDDLIAPLFVVEGKGRPQPIPSMPGVFRLSISDQIGRAHV
jgi:hypothetical protein